MVQTSSQVCHIMPFDDTKLKAMVIAQQNRAYHFPKKKPLSDEVIELVQCMLEPEVETRITLPSIKESPWLSGVTGMDEVDLTDLKFPQSSAEDLSTDDGDSTDPTPSTSSRQS